MGKMGQATNWNITGIMVYIKGKKALGISHVRLLGMRLQNAYGECVRIKYMATNNEVAYSHIQNCGLRDYVF